MKRPFSDAFSRLQDISTMQRHFSTRYWVHDRQKGSCKDCTTSQICEYEHPWRRGNHISLDQQQEDKHFVHSYLCDCGQCQCKARSGSWMHIHERQQSICKDCYDSQICGDRYGIMDSKKCGVLDNISNDAIIPSVHKSAKTHNTTNNVKTSVDQKPVTLDKREQCEKIVLPLKNMITNNSSSNTKSITISKSRNVYEKHKKIAAAREYVRTGDNNSSLKTRIDKCDKCINLSRACDINQDQKISSIHDSDQYEQTICRSMSVGSNKNIELAQRSMAEWNKLANTAARILSSFKMIGTIVEKDFGGIPFRGRVVFFDSPWYRVVYSDGDEEDYTLFEILEIRVDSVPLT